MTTLTLDHHRPAGALIGLGAWGVSAGALLQLVLGIPLASFEAQDPPAAAIVALNILSHVLLATGMVGLLRSEAAGPVRLAVAGPSITLLGLAVLIVAEGSWLVGLSASDTLYMSATFALFLGLTLTGVMVLKARRWTSWHRFTPLACGLFIPLVVLPSFALPGLAMNYALGLWGVCWLLLGVSLHTQAEAR